MPFKLKAFAFDTSDSQGNTGSVVLNDQIFEGLKRFSEAYADGQELIVVRDDDTGSGATEREVLRVTFDDTPGELDVLDVIESTNGDARINWPAGTRNVYTTISGQAALFRDNAGNTFDGDGVSPAKEPTISLGTQSSGTITPNPSDGFHQAYTNGGAHQLAATGEATPGFVVIITNNASAGAITTSGFDVVKGDSFTTTDGDVFECLITNTGTKQTLQVTALQ